MLWRRARREFPALPIQLDDIVPWGRSFDEYCKMFALDTKALGGSIVDCGGGPSSFNAEATNLGAQVISIDPLYAFDPENILLRIEQSRDEIMRQVRQHAKEYVWKTIRDPKTLESVRMRAMEVFLADYAQGRNRGRYVPAELPQLPFEDKQFKLALSSHLLFLYSDFLDLDFHKQALREMLRVAEQARVFPLMDLEGRRSRYVQPLCLWLHDLGYDVRITQVNYEFQRGANQMLRIQRASWTHPRRAARPGDG
jgi:hypothetical protein